MPKNTRKKSSKPPRTGLSGIGGEETHVVSENYDDNASTISNATSNRTYQDLDNSLSDNEVSGIRSTANDKQQDDVENIVDGIEIQLNTCLEGIQEKGFKEREESLKKLNKLFSHRYINDYLNDKRYTLTESIHKCLKRGDLSEQLLATQTCMLIFVQFGYSSEGESFLIDIKETLISLIKNENVDPRLRALCCKSLSIGLFINNSSTTESSDIMNILESIFKLSYLKGDKTVRIMAQNQYSLQASALSSWTLLLSVMPASYVAANLNKYLLKFQQFLSSPDTEMRITAGETLALMYEFGLFNESQSDLIHMFDNSELIEALNTLSKESCKGRSKKDKRSQHASFRDVLRTIEDSEEPEMETIRFYQEELLLDSWTRRLHYATFRDILGTGVNAHLQENESLRDIFDLGPVKYHSQDADKNLQLLKPSKMERRQVNKEQFRSRTKHINKKRDTKHTSSATANLLYGD